ncbi:MAG TPA: hypothetical protein VM243_21460 [Phycisphaerae bacterium]|nr:hypothetical protein [Phycisphaerae bacterium]
MKLCKDVRFDPTWYDCNNIAPSLEYFQPGSIDTPDQQPGGLESMHEIESGRQHFRQYLVLDVLDPGLYLVRLGRLFSVRVQRYNHVSCTIG